MPETTKAVPLGEIGRNVIKNIRELMQARSMSLRMLSERLGEIGRPILVSGLHRMINGQRRVDADDLVALAIALGVNPNALLLPLRAGREDVIELAPEVRQRSYVAWMWADGFFPLPSTLPPPGAIAINTPGDKFADWVAHARPDHAAPEPHPAVAELNTLKRMLDTILADPDNPYLYAHWRDTIIRRFRLVAIQLEELLARFDTMAMRESAFEFDPAAAIAQLRDAGREVRESFVGFAPSTEERYRSGARAARDRIGPDDAPTSTTAVPYHYGDEAGAARTVDPFDPFGERKNEP